MTVTPTNLPGTAITSTTATTVKNTFKLQAVEEQTTDLLATIRHILDDVCEAQRLRQLKGPRLDAGERRWMDRIIAETSATAREVALLLEPSRVDRETLQGKIRLRTRLLWVLRDSHKLSDKYARLMVCHQSLMSAITTLHGRAGPSPPVSPVPVAASTTDDLLPLSPLERSSSWAVEVQSNMGIVSPLGSDLNEMLVWRRSKHSTGGAADRGSPAISALAELPSSGDITR
ncbi:hypothetical protein MGYG_05008 [Nannizzia gypsea CBS 118893]|uniref:Uncharacterized protein n=1 Tax=Arthroderma gypseum (strain ATCC MYA-4604 / CBS 118893) TaxID=535722 RepID=E4UY12_ARTGP|nr:hypothetical protein MGYG_05008 [Nannizzia gypsea CBS 118893]EFR02005.1 hypothetical protein MGYG_05008 [Nannizzia gypsea CBS 118893]